jgi:nucleotide-binding universal stress UspA family protein
MTYATLLVNLESGQSNSHLLQVAAQLAARFQARVIGITACMPIKLLYGDGYIDGVVFEQDRQEIDQEIAAARAAFRDAMGTRARDLDWRSTVTFRSLADYLAAEARRADLILTASPSRNPPNTARQINLGDFIMQAGRPVLVVATEPSPLELKRVIVAWKDTREARRAAADALPILRIATSVSLVEIAPEAELVAARARLSDVAAWLERHNVTAECLPVVSDGEDADRLNAVAQERGADLIVAGAYGHSRVREWALGGVTRSLLGASVRSVFASH